MLFEHAFLNQVKTTLSRSLLSLFFKFFQLGFTWPDSYASMIFVLFAILVNIVFFFTSYSSATLFFVIFPSIFCNALYLFVIKVCTLHRHSKSCKCIQKIFLRTTKNKVFLDKTFMMLTSTITVIGKNEQEKKEIPKNEARRPKVLGP